MYHFLAVKKVVVNLITVVWPFIGLVLLADTLRAAYPYEPNDTRATAYALSRGTYQISGINDDWYKIAVNPGTVSFSMTPKTGTDVNMILYNEAGQVVGANFVNFGTEAFNWESNITGFVYLKVFPTASTVSDYSLTITTPLNSWARYLPFGPVTTASIALYDIDDDGRDEIFVGTSKLLDAQNNEILPAGLICLKDDGTIKWSVTFPAIAGPDSQTGKAYTSTSVSSAPAFSDVDGDGNIDIIVGVGADTSANIPGISGQPGDKGGVYAVNRNGQIMWFHQSLDIIGGASDTGDGRPDGVFGSPVVFDLDRDGTPEVIYNGWDQHVWILNGATGAVKRSIHLLDTIWSTPRIADINGDGLFEILVSADITSNPDAGTTTGGIFHVISADGNQNLAGWNTPVGNPNYLTLRGKPEEQVLWSSPITADLDGDGTLEIIYGTGNFFHDQRGSYIRVWKHDGTLAYKLSTGSGRTFATPLVADINGDGRPEIIAATLDGYLYAWNYLGQQIFAVNTVPFGGGTSEPIFSSPIAMDLDGDGKLEILYGQGAQLIVVSNTGQQLSSSTVDKNIFQYFTGSPAVGDLNHDGRLEIVSGGTDAGRTQGVVYHWDNPFGAAPNSFTEGRHQFNQSQSHLDRFVERFYTTILNRPAEPGGLHHWTDWLSNGVKTGAEVARGFIFSQEFMNRGLNNSDFIDVVYRAFFNRVADTPGKTYWVGQLNSGVSRYDVLNGFILSQEFFNLCAVYSILPSR